MNRNAKWTIGLLLGLIVLVPVSLGIAMWTGFRRTTALQTRAAEELVARFHENFNSDNVDGICNDTFTCDSAERARQIWKPTVDGVKARCGKFKSAVKSSIEVYVEPGSVRAEYISYFEKGQMREIFAMRDIGGHIKLLQYAPVTRIGTTSSANKCGDE